jgi:transcriptional regulator with XRE-family HTH domain
MGDSRPQRRRRRSFPDLATYIAETGQTQAYIARRVGTTQAHISRIANGDAVPRTLLAARIAAFARLPLDSFTRVHLAKHAASRVA